MKLHASNSAYLNTFTGYGDGYVEINERPFHHSVIVRPEGEVEHWAVARFDDLVAADFEQLLVPVPELVIFGSGTKLRFVHPRLVAALSARHIGVETMDIHAACRTYNILMAEGRKVAAALIIEAERSLA